MATSVVTRDDVEAAISNAPSQKLRTLRNNVVDMIIKARDANEHAAVAGGLETLFIAINLNDWATSNILFDLPALFQDDAIYQWVAPVVREMRHVANSSVIREPAQAEWGAYFTNLVDDATIVLGQIAAA